MMCKCCYQGRKTLDFIFVTSSFFLSFELNATSSYFRRTDVFLFSVHRARDISLVHALENTVVVEVVDNLVTRHVDR